MKAVWIPNETMRIFLNILFSINQANSNYATNCPVFLTYDGDLREQIEMDNIGIIATLVIFIIMILSYSLE